MLCSETRAGAKRENFANTDVHTSAAPEDFAKADLGIKPQNFYLYSS